MDDLMEIVTKSVQTHYDEVDVMVVEGLYDAEVADFSQSNPELSSKHLRGGYPVNSMASDRWLNSKRAFELAALRWLAGSERHRPHSNSTAAWNKDSGNRTPCPRQSKETVPTHPMSDDDYAELD
jgi:hypothetical protein